MAITLTEDNSPEFKAHTDVEGTFKNTEPSVAAICSKILANVKARSSAHVDAQNCEAMLKQAIRRALQSSKDQDKRMASNTVTSSITGNWRKIEDHFVYEISSFSSREYEIEMAMVVSLSTRVKDSVDHAVEIMLEVAQRALFPARDFTKMHSTMQFLQFLGELDKTAANARKMYYVHLPDKPTFSKLIGSGTKGSGSGRTFKESVVLLHDLLQVTWDFFGEGSQQVPDNARPLASGISVPVGIEDSDRIVQKPGRGVNMIFASDLAKSMAIPTEMGPSLTTVRFCQINNLQKTTGLLAKYNVPKLTDEERKHVALAIFAYWTIGYQKAYGGAHCFFFVNNSASQLGAPLAPVGMYPDMKAFKQSLAVNWGPFQDVEYFLRKKLLSGGIDQSSFIG